MNDKYSIIRYHILECLERGLYKEGDQLPGSRQLSQELGAAFAIVQNALATLVRDGVLESISRKGVFVKKNWHKRIIDNNLRTFYSHYFWYSGLKTILTDLMPDMLQCNAFENGMFEIRPTIEVQRNHRNYMDLSELFQQEYPDQSLFFSTPLESFKLNGKQFGIPFIFSPRVIFYNVEVFEKAGCKCPGGSWDWDEFTSCIKKLKDIVSPEYVVNWRPTINNWMNFVLRAGGAIIDPKAEDPIQIDNPKTQRGLALHSEIMNLLGVTVNYKEKDFLEQFVNGNAAMMIMPREVMPEVSQSKLKKWRTVPLPTIDGGIELTTQATDVLCIRKECTDLGLAAKFIRTMLSEEVQDYIGKQKYGIPLRKSSAFKSIDLEDERDVIFLNESTKMYAGYNLNSVEISDLIEKGIEQIWIDNLDIEKTTKELAGALRVLYRIKGGVS